MRNAPSPLLAPVSFVMAVLLAATPVTQVLAQTTQQESQVTQTSESMVHLSTPVVDSNTVLLLAPGSVEFSPAADSLPLLDPPTATAISTGGKIALVVVGILVVLGLALVIVCSSTACA